MVFADPLLFEYYGLWSAGGNSPIPDSAQLAKFAKISGTVHNGVGLQDWQNNIYPLSIQRAEAIRTSGVEVIEQNVNGIHAWDVWRQELRNFVADVAFEKSFTDVTVATERKTTTLQATVTSLSDHLAAPDGRVAFFADGRRIGAAPVDKTGTASLRLGRGRRAEGGVVTAEYSGDTHQRPSAGAVVIATE